MSRKDSVFEEAISRGIEGNISNYESWLSDRGLDVERATEEHSTQFFRDNPDLTSGLDEEVSVIGEYIGYILRNEENAHLAVKGVQGSGKTQLYYLLDSLLTNYDREIDLKYINADSFQRIDTGSNVKELVEEVPVENEKVVFIDDAWKDKKIAGHSLEYLRSELEQSLVITVWTPEKWHKNVESVNSVLPASEVVNVKPRSENQVTDITEHLVSSMAPSLDLELDTFSKQVYRYSFGIPGIAISLIENSLRQSYRNGFDIFSTKSVEAAAEKKNLPGIRGELRDISSTKKKVLENILMSQDERGSTTQTLSKSLKKDNSTVSYHLKDLESKRLISGEKYGRNVFYSVKKCVKPMLQLQLEGEYQYYE
ncbi:hypothetical protein [Candidatus Nanohalococcus occultus]|uniref:hypothetical protein n=1 Tax=Candidatus Nanohalococcus occultus TaxID=2978047 RepID=UPI0039E016B6